MWLEHGEQGAPHSPPGQLQALLPQARVAPDLSFCGISPIVGTHGSLAAYPLCDVRLAKIYCRLLKFPA